jgi:hypothetical protein
LQNRPEASNPEPYHTILKGTPTLQNWPAANALPDFEKICFDPIAPLGVVSVLPEASAAAAAMVVGCLVFESATRPSASEMLRNVYVV